MFSETRLTYASIRSSISCLICGGVLNDALSLTDCHHSFCRECLKEHVQKSHSCPVCGTVIHPIHPWTYIMKDNQLQCIVSKLKKIFSTDPSSAIMDECLPDAEKPILLTLTLEDPKYISCSCYLSIQLLKKFVKMKCDVACDVTTATAATTTATDDSIYNGAANNDNNNNRGGDDDEDNKNFSGDTEGSSRCSRGVDGDDVMVGVFHEADDDFLPDKYAIADVEKIFKSFSIRDLHLHAVVWKNATIDNRTVKKLPVCQFNTFKEYLRFMKKQENRQQRKNLASSLLHPSSSLLSSFSFTKSLSSSSSLLSPKITSDPLNSSVVNSNHYTANRDSSIFKIKINTKNLSMKKHHDRSNDQYNNDNNIDEDSCFSTPNNSSSSSYYTSNNTTKNNSSNNTSFTLPEVNDMSGITCSNSVYFSMLSSDGSACDHQHSSAELTLQASPSKEESTTSESAPTTSTSKITLTTWSLATSTTNITTTVTSSLATSASNITTTITSSLATSTTKVVTNQSCVSLCRNDNNNEVGRLLKHSASTTHGSDDVDLVILLPSSSSSSSPSLSSSSVLRKASTPSTFPSKTTSSLLCFSSSSSSLSSSSVVSSSSFLKPVREKGQLWTPYRSPLKENQIPQTSSASSSSSNLSSSTTLTSSSSSPPIITFNPSLPLPSFNYLLQSFNSSADGRRDDDDVSSYLTSLSSSVLSSSSSSSSSLTNVKINCPINNNSRSSSSSNNSSNNSNNLVSSSNNNNDNKTPAKTTLYNIEAPNPCDTHPNSTDPKIGIFICKGKSMTLQDRMKFYDASDIHSRAPSQTKFINYPSPHSTVSSHNFDKPFRIHEDTMEDETSGNNVNNKINESANKSKPKTLKHRRLAPWLGQNVEESNMIYDRKSPSNDISGGHSSNSENYQQSKDNLMTSPPRKIKNTNSTEFQLNMKGTNGKGSTGNRLKPRALKTIN
ncbi:hypothetical protein HELRODRAFT_189685 [Helobdella robusta]|uniref:RING-type domain-containing protein n=1 Tax=Helobdella robusta TaxID=6412 RepID=T1FR92_HELRO|nr:hypothetical protein HELRODRAFT_189685 [Helobdella robusta]ESN93116.1 hypothetical protein HELRODRAFT_189685 [Helobdella robusta]